MMAFFSKCSENPATSSHLINSNVHTGCVCVCVCGGGGGGHEAKFKYMLTRP